MNFISCKKPDTNPSTSQSLVVNYFPTSTGSFWRYSYDNGSMEYDSMPGDLLAASNGKLYVEYNEILTQNGHSVSDIGDICKSGGTYYGTIGLFGTSIAAPGNINDKVFVGGSKVGDTWLDKIEEIDSQGVFYWKQYTTVIKDVGISEVVQNKTYLDVVHFTLTVQGEQSSDIETIDFYVANNVGIIKEIEFDNANGKGYTKELISYFIK